MSTTFLDLVRTRRSVRGYDSRPVEPDKLDYILECARLAPSACNRQPCRFVVVDDPKLRERICTKAMGAPVPNPWAVTAPVIIVLCAAVSPVVHVAGMAVKGLDYRLIDAGIAGEHLCLAAAEKGLGTCWIGWFKQRALHKILDIPRTVKIIGLITVGYASSEPPDGSKNRMAMDEIRFVNRYQAP